MADLGESLPGAHPEVRRDNERQVAKVVGIEFRKRPGLLAQRLHPDEDTVTPRSTHGRQAGNVTHPFVIERAQVVPLAGIGPKADLAERMAPPFLEAVAPAFVSSESVGTPARRKRCRGRQLGEGSGCPSPDDEVHHERIVFGLHSRRVRNAGLTQEEPFAQLVVRVEDE